MAIGFRPTCLHIIKTVGRKSVAPPPYKATLGVYYICLPPEQHMKSPVT